MALSTESGSSEAGSALVLALVCPAIGVILGLAVGINEVAGHGYLALGFRRNALLCVREPLLLGAIYGCLLGIGLAGLRVFRAKLIDDRIRRKARPVLWATAVAQGTILARAMQHDSITLVRLCAIVLTLALWAGLYAVWRPTDRSALLSRIFADVLLLIPLALVPTALLLTPSMLGHFRTDAGLACAAAAGVLAAGGVWLSNRPVRGLLGWVLRASPAVFASLAALLSAVPTAWLPSGLTPARRSVVLIAIDTLRADHTQLLEAPASGRDSTPELRQFARRGTVFTRAFSQAPWTMPSFGSVMTGRYPSQHRAMSFSGYLQRQELTLAEILRESGMRTVAVVSHGYVDSKHGFAQGFDSFDEESSLGHYPITGHAVTEKALAQLAEMGDEPFFLFAHYFDPHYEYRDHADWSYTDGYEGWLQGDAFDIEGIRNARHRLSAADRRYLVDLYDEEIAFTDRELGRLLRAIADRYPDAAVVVVADHGEEFFERGWLGHTTTLHHEVIRVPLIAVLPDVASAPALVASTLETRSVFSTLLESAGVMPRANAPPSLQSLSRGGREGRAFTQVRLLDPENASGTRAFSSSLRTDSAVLIADHISGKTELYDLDSDPEEWTPLDPALRPELQRELNDWLNGPGRITGSAPRTVLTPERREQLRALGYLQ